MKRISYLLVLLAFFCSCSTQRRVDTNYTYFQKGLDSIGKIHFKEQQIKPNDQLSIQVISESLNQEQTSVFNMANGGGINGNSATSTTNNSLQGQGSSGFLVSEDGFINYPYVGKIYVNDITVIALRDTLTQMLSKYIKNPFVTIKLLTFKVNTFGELKSPGTKSFSGQRATILDAISASGDLTDLGRRDNVLILRQEKDSIKHYEIDLRDASKIYQSPVFQLQQNDLIYVRANNMKLKSVKRNPNFDRDIQVTLSVASIVTLFISLLNILK